LFDLLFPVCYKRFLLLESAPIVDFFRNSKRSEPAHLRDDFFCFLKRAREENFGAFYKRGDDRMNKAQLVEQLATELSITKAICERVLDSTIEGIKKSVKKGEDVTLVGFGTFTRTKRKARMGRNPQTGESIKVPACTVPKFRPGKAFKEFLN
jgi:DNA-binding protein HU-beta